MSKYEIGDRIGMRDYCGREIYVGDVVMCFDEKDPNSPWKYHFTTIGEGTLRDQNANNCYTWNPPIIDLGPYWRLLNLTHCDRVNGIMLVIDDDDLEYHWHTTRRDAAQRCIDELKGMANDQPEAQKDKAEEVASQEPE
jgi:hypothetical protein